MRMNAFQYSQHLTEPGYKAPTNMMFAYHQREHFGKVVTLQRGGGGGWEVQGSGGRGVGLWRMQHLPSRFSEDGASACVSTGGLGDPRKRDKEENSFGVHFACFCGEGEKCYRPSSRCLRQVSHDVVVQGSLRTFSPVSLPTPVAFSIYASVTHAVLFFFC